jgi:soluble lytic murein transglycosylase
MSRISRQSALKVVYWNVVAAVIVVTLAAGSLVRRQHAYDSLIVEIGRERNMDPRLISAVVWRESRFQVTAVGEKGEIGLMQVTGDAAGEWAEAEYRPLFRKHELFDPRTNLEAGTWYLKRAIQRWSHKSDPLPFALAEYNAGHSNAVRWSAEAKPGTRGFMAAITYPSTRTYIRTILRRYRGRV